MLENPQSISLLTLMEIAGPLFLAGALIYGIMMYRRRSRAQKALTEERTRDLYRKGAQKERSEGSV